MLLICSEKPENGKGALEIMVVRAGKESGMKVINHGVPSGKWAKLSCLNYSLDCE